MQQLQADNQPRDGTFTDTNTNSNKTNKTNKTKQATNLWMDPPQQYYQYQQDRQYQAGQPWYSTVGTPSGFPASIATQ